MHDAFFVRRRQSVAERAGNLEDPLDRKSPLGNEPVQWKSFYQLHRQQMDAVAFLHRMDRNDVRVVKLGEGLRLATKTRQTLRIVCHFGGEHLEGHLAPGFRVARAVYSAYPTPAT